MVLNRRLGWLPSVQNNSAELFHDYDQSIRAKADLVRTAERYVHVEYFMLCRDSTAEPFFQALLEVAARGVKVRVLFDHVSTLFSSGLQGDAGHIRRGRYRVAGDAAHPAPEGPLAAAGSAQPPQDRHCRRAVGVRRVAEHDQAPATTRRSLQAAGRTWRELTAKVEGPVVHSMKLRVRGRLVHRDQGERRTIHSNRRCSLTMSATSPARSCRVARGSRTRTTFACSTR